MRAVFLRRPRALSDGVRRAELPHPIGVDGRFEVHVDVRVRLQEPELEGDVLRGEARRLDLLREDPAGPCGLLKDVDGLEVEPRAERRGGDASGPAPDDRDAVRDLRHRADRRRDAQLLELLEREALDVADVDRAGVRLREVVFALAADIHIAHVPPRQCQRVRGERDARRLVEVALAGGVDHPPDVELRRAALQARRVRAVQAPPRLVDDLFDGVPPSPARRVHRSTGAAFQALERHLCVVIRVLPPLHRDREALISNVAIAALALTLGPGRLVDNVPHDVMVLENLRRLDAVPFLLCEGLNDLARGALRPPCIVHLVLAGGNDSICRSLPRRLVVGLDYKSRNQTYGLL